MPSGFGCIYQHCSSRSGGNIKLFGFPSDLGRSEVWLQAAQREDLLQRNLKNFKICEKHFQKQYVSTGGRLFKNAIPTLFSGAKRSNENSFSNSLDDDGEPPRKMIVLSDVTPRKADDEKPCLNEESVDTTNLGKIAVPSANQTTNEMLTTSLNIQKNRCEFPVTSPYCVTQITSALTSVVNRKNRLRYEIRSLKKELLRMNLQAEKTKLKEIQLRTFSKLCEKVFNKPLAEIVKVQANFQNKTAEARQYDREYEEFALTLYFLGPKSYAFLSKRLGLPAKRCLKKMAQGVVRKPGLSNDGIFQTFKLKVKTMSELDKFCNICIDETSLSSNLYFNLSRDQIVGFQDIGNNVHNAIIAQNVAVITVRGLFYNWKQPLVYLFVNKQIKSSEIRLILTECVQKLRGIGLHVQGLISGMGSNFIQLSKILNVTEKNPEFVLGEYKLLYIFDTPHLMEATKNNLTRNIFCFEDKKTSWKHVEAFYNDDKKQPYRCAPHLTDSHIYPTNFEKMRVKLATQVLSRTVANGMRTYLTLGKLPLEAVATIEVIEKFDQLFSMLNSTDINNSNKYKNVFQGLDYQNQFLDEMWMFLDKLRIYNANNQDITKKCRFRNWWMITIKSLQILWQHLAKAGFKYIKMRRVTQDCLANYFGSLISLNPTPIQFERAFRKLFCQSLRHSNQKSCEDDLGILFAQLKYVSNSNSILKASHPLTLTKTGAAIKLADRDYRGKKVAMQNVFTYVCGYLIKKALNIHKCDICIELSKQAEHTDISRLLLSFKAYDKENSNFGVLRSPNEDFIHYVYKLEKIFESLFDDLCSKPGISQAYYNEMTHVEFVHPCANFPLVYVIKLFIRLRIFYMLKFTNRSLRRSKKSKKPIKKLKSFSTYNINNQSNNT